MNWFNKWPEATGDLVAEVKSWDLASAPSNSTTIISFQDGNSVKNYEVIIVGDLGLCYNDPDGWSMYHMPTLTNFNSAVPPISPISYSINDINAERDKAFDYEQSELLEWMKKVQEGKSTAWQMLRLLTPDNYANSSKSAKKIIKEWCLSVSVKG